MSRRRRTATTIMWGIVLGALLAAMPGGQARQLSVEVWLSVLLVWLALASVFELFDISPVIPGRLLLPWRLPRRPVERRSRLPRKLVALEGTVISARDNDRAYALRLRPRLRDVAHHFLAVHHGIDATSDPERAGAALGDVAWLVDERSVGTFDRPPTLDEIDELLDRVLPDETLDSQEVDDG